MLIELIKDKENEWKCRCNGANIARDIENRAYVTVDNIRFWDKINDDVKELCQYPYTHKEWLDGGANKYRCKKCDKVPYRSINNNRPN